MRNDKLVLRTDEEEFLYAGWDYGAPYSLDPLNGVSVDLKTAQSVNQIGTTVEQQSVAGVYRELIIDFWGPNGEAQAKKFLDALPYFTKGTMYLGDKWFCRFVLSKTPYTKQLEPYPRLDIMLYCEKPFWYDLNQQSYLLGGLGFSFPENYSVHQYRSKTNERTNCKNPGSLPVGFTATLSCSETVKNPCIRDVAHDTFIGLTGFTMQPGETVEFYQTETGRLAVKKTVVSKDSPIPTEENIFSYLDEDSTLTELRAGNNWLLLSADTGETALQAKISFYPMYAGILPEVISNAT